MKLLTPAFKAQLKNCRPTPAQARTVIRLCRRWETLPNAIHPGPWIAVIFGGLYVGIEKDGYAHT